VDVPETRYAKTTDGIHIAYQVLGDGPGDLVFEPGFVFNVVQAWEWPQMARFARRLSTFCRLIRFDRRGTGLSDHIIPHEAQLTLESRMDDIRAVMDAAGSERAACSASRRRSRSVRPSRQPTRSGSAHSWPRRRPDWAGETPSGHGPTAIRCGMST